MQNEIIAKYVNELRFHALNSSNANVDFVMLILHHHAGLPLLAMQKTDFAE